MAFSPTSPTPQQGSAQTRTGVEKQKHLDAARYPAGQRAAAGMGSLADWLMRSGQCMVVDCFTSGTEEVEALLSQARHAAFEKNTVLYHQDSQSHKEAYILLDGQVSLYALGIQDEEAGREYVSCVHHTVATHSLKSAHINAVLSSNPTSPTHGPQPADLGNQLAAGAVDSLFLQSSSPRPRKKTSMLRSMAPAWSSFDSLDGSSDSRPASQAGNALHGKTEECPHGHKLKTLAEGESFGELAFALPSRPRAVTAVAETDVEILIVNKDYLKHVSTDVKEKSLVEKLDVLQANAVFLKWSWMALSQMASHMTEITVAAETTVSKLHNPVAAVYFIKSGQVRLQSAEKSEIKEVNIGRRGGSPQLRDMRKMGSSDRLELPSQGITEGLHSKVERSGFKFKKLADVTTLGRGDVIGAYEVAKRIGNYTFASKVLETTVLYEIPASKFSMVVKKYSRKSFRELTEDAAVRFGLKQRQRKRSGSCPEAMLLGQLARSNASSPSSSRPESPSSFRTKLPPLSFKTRPRPVITAGSNPGSPAISRQASVASSSSSTPGSGTPRLPALNTSRPGSPHGLERAGLSSPDASLAQVSNLLSNISPGSPTVVRRLAQSPATGRQAIGRFDSPGQVRRGTRPPLAHSRSETC